MQPELVDRTTGLPKQQAGDARCRPLEKAPGRAKILPVACRSCVQPLTLSRPRDSGRYYNPEVSVPDLTFHLAQHCAQIGTAVSRAVESSSGAGAYQVYVCGDTTSCTCPGHKFHGHCKHVETVRAQMCDWDSQDAAAEQTTGENVRMKCPRCEGPTRWTKVAA